MNNEGKLKELKRRRCTAVPCGLLEPFLGVAIARNARLERAVTHGPGTPAQRQNDLYLASPRGGPP